MAARKKKRASRKPAKRKPAPARKRASVAKRGSGGRKRAAPASRTERTIRKKVDALDELAGRVKSGAVRVGGTRKLTPTKAGFRALAREVSAVRKAITKKGAKPRAYSFQLSIRYRGADGRFKKLERVEGTFPLKKSLTRRKKKGETDAAAFERVTETRIKAAVFRAIDRAEGVIGYTPAVQRALASGDRDRITRAMRAFKKRRGVTFKVDVERHVTPGEARGNGQAKKRRDRAKARGKK